MQKLFDLINWWRNRDSQRTLGTVRSLEWSQVRAEYLKSHPTCAVCGGKEQLECHHKKPFHKYPNLELDPNNLITLCSKPSRECHLTFGHLGSFRSWNEDVEDDAKEWNKKIRERP